MKIDSEVAQLIEDNIKLGLPPVYTLSIEEARQRMRNAFIVKENKEKIFNIEEYQIPYLNHQIPLRVYYPNNSKNLPCLLFFHGGGWTINDLDTHDALCRSITNLVSCIVISVDYRRAPEHKFPAAIEDSYAALEWVEENASMLYIDSSRIAVGGDSSGGNQATVTCLLSRDKSGPKIMFQWLAYPITDYHTPLKKSYIEMAEGYSLNKDFMFWFWDNYTDVNTDYDNPYLCPLRSTNLKNLPPAFIMTANFDPLRDEGELYASKLKQNGNIVTLKRYEGQMHGFLMVRGRVKKAQEGFLDAINELKQAFANK